MDNDYACMIMHLSQSQHKADRLQLLVYLILHTMKINQLITLIYHICTGSAFGKNNFLHTIWYSSIFSVCDQSRADNTLLREALAQQQGLFCCSHHPANKEDGLCQKIGRGQSCASWPQYTQGISNTV